MRIYTCIFIYIYVREFLYILIIYGPFAHVHTARMQTQNAMTITTEAFLSLSLSLPCKHTLRDVQMCV